MPQRFFRPGIRTSERWNSVSREAQALYIAILTLVDDFGRYDGRYSVLHGDAFSVWNEINPKLAVNPQRTAALCGELQKARLVHFYEVQGKKCLQMIQWEERIRDGAKEKWPKPNESDIPQESAGIRSVPLPPSSPSPSPSPPSPASSPNGTSHQIVYSPESRIALHWLNEKTGKRFRETETSLAPINARLSEPDVDIEGVKMMIERQCQLWAGTKMQEYLTPTTLFGKEKFSNYYANREQPIILNDKPEKEKHHFII